MTRPNHVALLRSGIEKWNSQRLRRPNTRPDLASADLHGLNLRGANLARTNLEWSNLSQADLTGADLGGADLSCANLTGATLDRAFLCQAKLDGAFLSGASLRHADLRGASAFGAMLQNANFTGASLVCAYFEHANLRDAVLVEANLSKAILRSANLTGATIVRCNVHGTACWDLALAGSTQEGLCVSPEGAPAITVDSIELAQFIYLMLNNKNLRTVIDTITSKAVLILGRFTRERKEILDALHKALRTKHDLVPILFDFAPSVNRNLTETIQLLASMCRFVIADITDAKSIPQELSHIVPNFPSVPIQPIIQAAAQPYAMFEHWRGFVNVLPAYAYENGIHLLRNFDREVLAPVEQWKRAADKTVVREDDLRKRNAKQKAEIARLKSLLRSRDRSP